MSGRDCRARELQVAQQRRKRLLAQPGSDANRRLAPRPPRTGLFPAWEPRLEKFQRHDPTGPDPADPARLRPAGCTARGTLSRTPDARNSRKASRRKRRPTRLSTPTIRAADVRLEPRPAHARRSGATRRILAVVATPPLGLVTEGRTGGLSCGGASAPSAQRGPPNGHDYRPRHHTGQ